jgi:hypothetical protein
MGERAKGQAMVDARRGREEREDREEGDGVRLALLGGTLVEAP